MSSTKSRPQFTNFLPVKGDLGVKNMSGIERIKHLRYDKTIKIISIHIFELRDIILSSDQTASGFLQCLHLGSRFVRYGYLESTISSVKMIPKPIYTQTYSIYHHSVSINSNTFVDFVQKREVYIDIKIIESGWLITFPRTQLLIKWLTTLLLFICIGYKSSCRKKMSYPCYSRTDLYTIMIGKVYSMVNTSLGIDRRVTLQRTMLQKYVVPD